MNLLPVFPLEQLTHPVFPWIDGDGNVWPLETLRDAAEHTLISSCTHFTYLYFQYCRQANEWGESGESAQHETVLRMALKRPYSTSITPNDLTAFESYLDTQYKRFEIPQNQEIDYLKEAIEDFKIDLFGNKLKLSDAETINSFLRNLGSDLYIQAGTYGTEQELIIGKGRHTQIGDYQVIDLTEEICHTGNVNITLAAAIGHRQIFIRHHSLQSIFEIKWLSFLTYPYSIDTPDGKAGAAIKSIVCRHYGFVKSDVAPNQQDQFIEEMRDSILFHEIGHGIIQHNELPPTIGAFSEATKLISHPLIHTLLETLAELAPKTGDYHGPVRYICDVSDVDRQKATRQFWMYISDTWFFDTDSEYMYLYSEIIEKIFLSCAETTTAFDFQRLKGLIWDSDGIYPYLLRQTIEICEHLISFLKAQSYSLKDQDVDFETLFSNTQTELLGEASIQPDPYVFESGTWAKILEIALQDEAILSEILTQLDRFQNDIIQTIGSKTSLNTHEAVLNKINTTLP